MEPNPKASRRRLTVAEAMERVRWDYHPRHHDRSPASETTGDFFDTFPWEGSPDQNDSAEEDYEPDAG